MAVSDPTMGVPTPTGVLQGVAAFNWDGAAWQPSAVAGPCVATPTGNLQGIAPFSWNGSAWTPTGRSQPGVATPTGVLGGVALYTWSGSAWTPASGQPTPSTPTGALRGVAGFQWDGSAWQPAGQAGPDVATPFGVLQGVAMFNWTGNAWAGTGPPSLDINLLSATLDPSITWTRANATATDGLYTDAAGSGFNSFAANAPRINTTSGLLVENAGTNFLLNSGAAVTQTTGSLATGTYCLWVIGTGTATSSAGTATGSAFGVASVGVPNVFTVSVAGTVVITVAGSLTRFQLEKSPYPTSYIPTTAATATRAIDSGILPTAAWFNAAAGTFVVDFMQRQITPSLDLTGLSTDSSNNLGFRLVNATPTLFSFVGNVNSGQQIVSGTMATNVPQRAAFTYVTATKAVSVVLNGGPVLSNTFTNLPSITQIKFGIIRAGAQDGVNRRIRYWPRALTSSELQQVTA